LRSLTQIGQIISVETDPVTLYRTIHEQIVNVIGELDSFAIAIYDAPTNTIRLPYMVEQGQTLHIDPFPLGQGLTSIVIRTGQPLMIVEDTERKSRELGAMTVGQPARSWLGVPLIMAAGAAGATPTAASKPQVIGAILAQDIEREHRFTEEDQRLLTTIASQVTVVIRNARLLETTRLLAEQERRINEITARIRRQVDIESIIKTTADEIGRALHARRLNVVLGGLQSDEHVGQPVADLPFADVPIADVPIAGQPGDLTNQPTNLV
jgi:GAF domain-containing protein